MKKTLTWEILQHFSRKEIRAFGVFLNSPFFNVRKDLVIMNQILAKAIIAEIPLPNKKELFIAVFPREIFSDQKLRLTLSRLHKLLEKFLLLEELENTSFEKEKLLLSAFRKLKLERNFNRTFKKINANLEKQALRNPAYYFTHFYLENQNYLALSALGRLQELNLKKVEEYLDFAYVSTKLRQVCFTLSHQAVFNIEYNSALFEPIIALVEQGVYDKEPAIVMYYQFIKLFQKGDLAQFEQFKQHLFQQNNYFTTEEFRDIFLLSLNFCIKKINENEIVFFQETLDMYKKGLALELLFENGKLSRFTYNNIVAIALYRDDLSWVENFVHHYKDYLDTSYKVAAFSLNMARIEYVKKNFKASLIFLQNADYIDLISHMTAKILQIKIYFDLKEYDSLDSLIQSLRVFIQRKKGMGYHYQIWKNILYYTKSIRQVNPYDKKAVEILQEKIEKELILPEREWLLEKLLR